jgi:polygalacturonase
MDGTTTAVTTAVRAAGIALPDIPQDRRFDIRDYGAIGDSKTIDSGAINRAIDRASAAGGGTVHFPPGTYLSYSIRLKSRVRLHLDRDAVILAADPPHAASETAGYDPPEESVAARSPYQDFGHSHWRNSLISGIGLSDIAIEGQGRIWGRGLVNGDYEPGHLPAMQHGVGNKAIALFGCDRVLLRGISILRTGHFGVLATGTNALTVDGLAIDTNRDGLNFDCCRSVHVLRCRINSPNDDAICLKSTYALGRVALTEDILIEDCRLTGKYRIGATMDGSYRLRGIGNEVRANVTHRTGRMKLGTESIGGFRNVIIRNLNLSGCRGIALETVDGGVLENIDISGLTMRDVRNSPIYIRLGGRLNTPEPVRRGLLRHVTIRDVECLQPYSAMPMIVSGIPGAMIEDVTLSHIHMRLRGGGTERMAAIMPPEAVRSYPDPESFGVDLPACGLFARHVRGLTMHDLRLDCARPDRRPAVWLRDVEHARIVIPKARGVQNKAMIKVAGAVRALRVSAT